jgi:hypothetical protein
MAGVKRSFSRFLAPLLILGVASAGTPFSDEGKPRFPLDVPPVLVATFGEYRPDHLHPGVDFSTGGKTGLPVHAVESGQIFRLKVEWRGYGRALYLRHADGRISVYAHLERYEDRRLGLERRVAEEKRNRSLRYPGDIFLEPPVPVHRGDVVGYSGESGAGLPHLHYEMRRQDQEPSDPLSPGWLRSDSPPTFESLLLRADSADSWIDGERTEEFRLNRRPDGVYVAGRVPALRGPFLPEARVSLQDREGHRLGISSLTARVDGAIVYRWRMKSFRFSQYPEVGLLLDHARSGISPPEYTYFLTRLPGNDLGESPAEERPWPTLPPGDHRLEVEAGSALGEISRASLSFTVLPPTQIQWEGDLASGALQTIRFGAPRSLLGPGVRVAWSSAGSVGPVSCPVLQELSDGETCRLSLAPGSSGEGVTAGFFQGAALLQRVTRFPPRDPGLSPAPPRFKGEVSRRFVDLRLQIEKGQVPPESILLKSESQEQRFSLVQAGPRELLGSLPSEAWEGAASVEVEWRTASGPRAVSLPLLPHHASVESGLKLEDCGIRLLIEAGSPYEDFPLLCQNPDASPEPGEDLLLLGRPIRLLPEGTPLSRKGTLTFSLPADPHPERIGIYRRASSGKGWVFEGGDLQGDEIRLPIGRLDTFALLRDDSPPRILGIDPSGPRTATSARPVFHIAVEDRGAGLNYDGVHLFLDGKELETEFDPDRGWSTATPERPLAPGTHAGSVWAMDRAGNRSKSLAFEVRVR